MKNMQKRGNNIWQDRENDILEEQIKKQEETVLKVKEKYDSEMMKLKDLYAKRNEEKKKELLKAVENSTKHMKRSWHLSVLRMK